MLTTFFAMVSALITIFGIILPTYHYATKGYKEAEQKGYNPMISLFLYTFVGYTVGLTITSLFLAMVEYTGFPVKYYNCKFFLGNPQACLQITNTNQQQVDDFQFPKDPLDTTNSSSTGTSQTTQTIQVQQ